MRVPQARRWLAAAAGSRARIAVVCGSATVPRCRPRVVGRLAACGIADAGAGRSSGSSRRPLSQQASSGAGGGGERNGGPSLASSSKTADGARELCKRGSDPGRGNAGPLPPVPKLPLPVYSGTTVLCTVLFMAR